MTTLAPFNPFDVPPAEDDGTRFALGRNPSGHPAHDGDAVPIVYSTLAAKLFEEPEPLTPKPVTVKLKRVVFNDDTQEYELKERTTVVGVPVFKNRRPGMQANLKLSGGAAIDSLFLRGPAFDDLPDHRVFEELLVLCREIRPKGHSLRRLNDLVCEVLCVRAGLAKPTKLKWEPPAS